MIQVPLATSTPVLTAVAAVPALILAALYARRAHTLAAAGRAVAGRCQLCFYGGLALAILTIALLDGPSHRMAVWHALADVSIGDLAPLLLALGLTGPLLAPLRSLPGASLLRRLCHPFPAFGIWALDLFGWHLARFYEAALRHASLYSLEYLTTFASGALMWICLLGPVRHPRWFGDGAKLLYALVVRLTGLVMGNLLLWAGGIVYASYLQEDALRQLSPIADENLAGALILLDQAVMLIGVFAWLYMRARSSDAHKSRTGPTVTVGG